MSLEQLYTNMLKYTDHEEISVQMQEHIYDYALKHKDHAIMAKLAHYPNLSKSLDDLIGANNTLEILTAWLTRQGRTPAEQMSRLEKENRVTTLLVLAKQHNLPREAYMLVAKHQTPTLDETLAGNYSVPLDIRLTKLRAFVKRPITSRSLSEQGRLFIDIVDGRVSDTLPRQTEPRTPASDLDLLYNEVANTSFQGAYLEQCIKYGKLSSQQIDRMIDNIEIIDGSYAASRNTYSYHIGIDIFLLALSNYNITSSQHTRLLENTRALLASVPTRSTNHISQLKKTIQTLEAVSFAFEDALFAFIHGIATDPIQDMFDTAFSLVDATPASALKYSRLMTAVAVNLFLSGDTALTMVKNMAAADHAALAQNLENRGDYASLVAMLKIQTRNPLGSLNSLKDEKKVTMFLIEDFYANHNTIPEWLTRSDIVRADASLCIKHVAMPQLVKLTEVVPNLSSLVSSMILEILGSQEVAVTKEAWEIFDTLGESFKGTLPDLLESIKILAES
jgi:hypothetical protein